MSASDYVGIVVFVELLPEYESLSAGLLASQHHLRIPEAVHRLGKCQDFIKQLDDFVAGKSHIQTS